MVIQRWAWTITIQEPRRWSTQSHVEWNRALHRSRSRDIRRKHQRLFKRRRNWVRVDSHRCNDWGIFIELIRYHQGIRGRNSDHDRSKETYCKNSRENCKKWKICWKLRSRVRHCTRLQSWLNSFKKRLRTSVSVAVNFYRWSHKRLTDWLQTLPLGRTSWLQENYWQTKSITCQEKSRGYW